MIAKDGATALVRGASVTYYGSIFYGGSYFYTYPWFKKRGNEMFYGDDLNKEKSRSMLYFMSGFISEYIALLLYFPFETVKVRF